MNFVRYFVHHGAPLNTHNLTLYQLTYHLVKLDFGWFVNEDKMICAEMVKFFLPLHIFLFLYIPKINAAVFHNRNRCLCCL